MQLKSEKSVTVVFVRQELSIREVGHSAAIHTGAILEEISKHGIEPCGPWIFVHFNLPKNGKDRYFAEFCLPVPGVPEVDLKFPVKTLGEFPCASLLYAGPLRSLFTKGVQPLVREMKQAGLPISCESREVYHKWVDPKSKDNLIEIQFGTSSAS